MTTVPTRDAQAQARATAGPDAPGPYWPAPGGKYAGTCTPDLTLSGGPSPEWHRELHEAEAGS